MTHTKIKEYSCEECGRQFAYRSDVARHIRTQHTSNNVKNPILICIECGKSFTNKTNLIIHERSHTGEKPFNCDFCEERFRLDRHLEKHRVKAHNVPFPNICDLCGKGFLKFRFKDSLAAHRSKCGVGKVFEERKTKCEICEKEFKKTDAYNRHMKSHNKQKDFPCIQCEKAFADKRNLLAHTERQHMK